MHKVGSQIQNLTSLRFCGSITVILVYRAVFLLVLASSTSRAKTWLSRSLLSSVRLYWRLVVLPLELDDLPLPGYGLGLMKWACAAAGPVSGSSGSGAWPSGGALSC